MVIFHSYVNVYQRVMLWVITKGLWLMMGTHIFWFCDSQSSAHTPKLDSYEQSYQTWGHAPGQPALKGSSYLHADSIQDLIIKGHNF